MDAVDIASQYKEAQRFSFSQCYTFSLTNLYKTLMTNAERKIFVLWRREPNNPLPDLHTAGRHVETSGRISVTLPRTHSFPRLHTPQILARVCQIGNQMLIPFWVLFFCKFLPPGLLLFNFWQDTPHLAVRQQTYLTHWLEVFNTLYSGFREGRHHYTKLYSNKTLKK
jgi:hypothetical protein